MVALSYEPPSVTEPIPIDNHLWLWHPFVIHMDDIMKRNLSLEKKNVKAAKTKWPDKQIARFIPLLRELTRAHRLSVAAGDIILLNGGWYVTHSGLLRLARRSRCTGIHVQPTLAFCDPCEADPVETGTDQARAAGLPKAPRAGTTPRWLALSVVRFHDKP